MTCVDVRLIEKNDPRFGLSLLIGLIVLIAAGKPILFDTLDPDCFWHLCVADQLRTDGIGPLVDRLSFASIQRPWTPYSWLAELGMAAVWRSGGWRAAVVSHSILGATFIVFISAACRTRPRFEGEQRGIGSGAFAPPVIPGALESAAATAVAGFVSLPYLSFRPVTAALALLAVCAWLIVRDRRSGERSLAVWLLLPVTALLINLHLYAVLVPIWVFALALGAIVERRRARPEDRPEAERRLMRYGWLLLGTTIGCLMTPMLPGVIATALRYQYVDPMVAGGVIAEMKPFYHGIAGKISLGLIVLLCAAAALGRRRVRIGDWIWLAASGVLLLRLGRFAPAFAIVAAPLFAATMPELSSRLLARKAVCGVMALVLIGGMARLAVEFPRPNARLETWLNRHGKDTPGYPCAAAEYVAEHVTPMSGRLINEFNWGGYLEWRLGDRYQTLLDGRTQLFTPSFWHATYLDGEDRRAQYFAQVRADAAILPVERSLFQDVLTRQGWRVAYEDDRARVLVPPPGMKPKPGDKWPFAEVLFGE